MQMIDRSVTHKLRRALSDDRIFALCFVVLFLIFTIPRLFGPGRIGGVNWGEYDAVMPVLGIEYTDEYRDNPDRYYDHPIEEYALGKFDAERLLQLKPTSAMIYPGSLARTYALLTNQLFSTRMLAAVYLGLIAIGIYFLLKGAYRLFGGFSLALAVCILFFFTGDGIIGYLTSLYEEGSVVSGAFLFAGALMNAAAARRGRWTALIGLYASALYLSLNKQGLFLPVACFALASVLIMSIYHRPKGKYLLRYRLISLFFLVLSGVLMWSFHLTDPHYLDPAHRYDAVYGGLLAVSDDPAADIAELGLPSESIEDIGLSIYRETADYAYDPNRDSAQADIFNNIGIARVAEFYLRHPDRFGAMAEQLLKSAGAYENNRLMYALPEPDGEYRAVSDRGMYNTLRSILFANPLLACALLTLLYLASALLTLIFCSSSPGKRALAAVGVLAALLPLCLLVMQLLLFAFGYASFVMFSQRLTADFLIATGCIGVAIAFSTVGRLFVQKSRDLPPGLPDVLADEKPVFGPLWKGLGRGCAATWRFAARTPARAALIATVLSALTIYLVLFFPPHIGARNNGDYARAMLSAGVTWVGQEEADDSLHTNIETFPMKSMDYSTLTLPNPALSQAYLSAAQRMLGFGQYDTWVASVLCACALLIALFLSFRALNVIFGTGKGTVINLALIFILLGKINLGWINSMYGEGLEFLGFIMVCACALTAIVVRRGRGFFLLIPLTLCGQFLIAAKGQAALTAPSVILLLIVLGAYHLSGRRPKPLPGARRKLAVASCGALLALMVAYTGAFGYSIYAENQRENARQTVWQSLFTGLLVVSDSPADALQEFGLDERMIADIGKHAYLPEDQYVAAPTSKAAQTQLYDKVDTMKILKYYLRHPGLLLRILDHCASAAADRMPDWFIYDGQRDDMPRQTVDRFSLWENFRERVVPRSFSMYALFFAVTMGWAAALIVRRRGDANARLRLSLWLFLAIALISVLQFPLTVIGNGLTDNVKQLYLHRMSFDVLLLIAFAQVASLAVLGVRRHEARFDVPGQTPASGEVIV